MDTANGTTTNTVDASVMRGIADQQRLKTAIVTIKAQAATGKRYHQAA